MNYKHFSHFVNIISSHVKKFISVWSKCSATFGSLRKFSGNDRTKTKQLCSSCPFVSIFVSITSFCVFINRRCHLQPSKCTTLSNRSSAPPQSTRISSSHSMNCPGWCKACLCSPPSHVVDPDLAQEGVLKGVERRRWRVRVELWLLQGVIRVFVARGMGSVEGMLGKDEGKFYPVEGFL